MSSASKVKVGKTAKANKVVKPKKNTRRTTETTRNHRYKSFNERIANLKIDPIRKRRHVEEQETAVEASHTYFGASLEEWKDTNLSATFTAFAKDASPLCDNLPVVLHNEEAIMDLMVTYLEKADEYAMEPLLNLLAQFAHDLDTRFEKHFQRAVATVTAVASKHPDPAVTEWSFNCLAWLFKYLSRLLIPNLRPLYDLLAPYLGKEKQKPYIVRFAAQAMSFLVRKAAMLYERDQKPLDIIMQHMLEDCRETSSVANGDLLQQGLMTLITEAVQGVQYGIHSGGVAVLRSLFEQGLRVAQSDLATTERIVCGALTSLIHATNAEGFKPVLETILSFTERVVKTPVKSSVRLCCGLLFTAVSVRKGSRITDWKTVMDATKSLISASQQTGLDDGVTEATLGLFAVTLQTATIDAVLAARQTLEELRTNEWVPYFVKFCDMAARLGRERFDSFILPHFQKFVLDQSATGDAALLSLIPRLGASKSDFKLKCPKSMANNMVERIAMLNDEGGAEDVAHAHAMLAAARHMIFDDEQRKKLHSDLLTLVKKALNNHDAGPELRCFSVGPAFSQVLDATTSLELENLWVPLCNSSPEFRSLPGFWSNLVRFMKTFKPTNLSGEHLEALESTLISCLTMASHPIRQDALDILAELYQLRGLEVPSILATAITVESIPISLETARSISMNVRRLPPDYLRLSDGDLMQKAIPSYCFGLLHLSLSQAWDDAINALAAICEIKVGEDTVISLAQAWIDSKVTVDSSLEGPTIIDVETDGFKALSDFECPNLMKLLSIRTQVFEEANGGLPLPVDQLKVDLRLVPSISLAARTQALKVLNKIPQVAEKRSRLLVPVLLRWAGAQMEDEHDTNETDRWARKDQKALLTLFSHFVNPRVLYRSSEVFDALLALCGNGDVEIQQSALKALLSWKDKSVTRYEEHLMNLLDEARFREELSVFLQDAADDENGEGIRVEDHPTLMPVLLRLLYGRSVAGGKEGQAGRRKAIFVALSRFGEFSLGEFLKIALKSLPEDEEAVSSATQVQTPLRQQLGLVNMMNDMLQVLGSELQPFASRLLKGILACTVTAAQRLDEEDAADGSLLRSIRQTGIQCLVKIFTTMTDIDPHHHGKIIVDALISPRLDSFANENAQSISGTLRLFSAWCESNGSAALFAESGGIMLQRVADLLRGQHAKVEVRLFVLRDILDKLMTIDIDESILQPYVSAFVTSIGSVLDEQPSKDLLDACVHSFSQLANRITSKEEALHVTKICTELLTKPNRAVSPRTKAGLLQTIFPLIEKFDLDAKDQLYGALCALYSRLVDPESRILLAKVHSSLARGDPELSDSAHTCEDMNAMSTRLDEADHNRRERAFTKVYESGKSFSLQQWLPIVHNLLFYIRDGEDRVNRTSSSHALRLFVDATTMHFEEPAWVDLLENTLLSGIERGMHEKSELVRSEYLLVLNHIVESFPTWQKVAGMQSLIVGGDEEASFFTNVLHIQQHRRARALRRLAEDAASLGSTNASRIFLPLLEHFVFDPAEGDSGRTLADQAVQSIGSLAQTLNKSAFRATFQRYVGQLKAQKGKEEDNMEKVILRLLGAMVDGLRNAAEASGTPLLSEAIIKEQLPPLLEYLHQKDDSTVDRRMPVAVTIVKLMKGLSEEEFAARLPAVLTDVSHVLRSRSQEARDQTRKALMSISSIIGSTYFKFILKELRSALKRGYQLHVLSFTVHSLLVEPHFQPGDLDECLPELMDVIMDDIFGVTGQEKDAEEYKSGMKEIKSSKSYDTMELLARVTPIRKLGALISPIRNLLSETMDMRAVKKIDDLLLRLRKGVDQNPESDSREMLAFCWQIVSQVYAEENAPPPERSEIDERRKRYLVQPEPAKKKERQSKGSTTSYRFKLISFALNLLRKVVRRHEDLQTPANMAGFLPMAGDALVQGQEEVKLSAVRLLSTIMRVPMKQLGENAPVYIKEAVAMIEGAVSSTTDASKAALELITSILREKRSVPVKEKDVARLLKRLKTDVDEPDRQGIIYKFLRAVLGRKIVIAEVYEVMDEVGKAMVTNPDHSIRESARSAYLQFVMEFPQGKDRWDKQTAFLVGNLRYEHAPGRKSVMEFLNQMLGKVGENVLEERAPKIFLSLVPILVADPDQGCRQSAEILIEKVFQRATNEKLMAQLLAMMETWLGKDKSALLKSGSLQCWAILTRTKQLSSKRIELLRDKIEEILVEQGDEISEPRVVFDSLQAFAEIVKTAPEVAFAQASQDVWQAIQDLPRSDDERVHGAIASLLGAYFNDMASASSKANGGLQGIPLRGSGGLELSAQDMRRLCAVSLRALRAITLNTSEALAKQIVANLTFLGRCFSASSMPWTDTTERSPDASGNDEEDDERDEDEETEGTARDHTAIAHLLRRLSSMLMADKFSIVSRNAAIHCLASVINTVHNDLPVLQTILRPLYALTDPTVPKPPGELHKALTDKAHEVLEGIQKQMGSQAYLAALAETRNVAKARRDERRQKRRIEAVAEPERWQKSKQRRYEVKKVKKKEKGEEARGRRRGW